MTAAKEIPTPPPNPSSVRIRSTYTPTARSVSLSRHRAARLVLQWGHPLMAGDVALVVSELATNSVMHGAVRGRLFRVHLTLTEFVLRVAVSDPRGSGCPGSAGPGTTSASGAGS